MTCVVESLPLRDVSKLLLSAGDMAVSRVQRCWNLPCSLIQ